MQDMKVIFEGVEDPRHSNATRHDIHEMPMIALPVTLSGGKGCPDMAPFGRCREDFLRRFMKLEHGIPSHDAFSDLFSALDPEGTDAALLRLAGDWAERLGDGVTATDGKATGRSFADATGRSPLHLVQAFAAGAGVVPGQVRVSGRSDGITAMPALLDLPGLRGRTVTADAMHRRRETAERVTARGGDHVLAPKAARGACTGMWRNTWRIRNCPETLTFPGIWWKRGMAASRPGGHGRSTTWTGCGRPMTGPAWRRSGRSTRPGRPGTERRPGPVTIPLVTLEAPPIPSSPCTSPLPAAGISCLSTFSPFPAGAGVSRG